MLSVCGEKPPVDMVENMTVNESYTPMPVSSSRSSCTTDRPMKM
jgi:hypothetical protein